MYRKTKAVLQHTRGTVHMGYSTTVCYSDAGATVHMLQLSQRWWLEECKLDLDEGMWLKKYLSRNIFALSRIACINVFFHCTLL